LEFHPSQLIKYPIISRVNKTLYCSGLSIATQRSGKPAALPLPIAAFLLHGKKKKKKNIRGNLLLRSRGKKQEYCRGDDGGTKKFQTFDNLNCVSTVCLFFFSPLSPLVLTCVSVLIVIS
jgi:hypothetical protein